MRRTGRQQSTTSFWVAGCILLSIGLIMAGLAVWRQLHPAERPSVASSAHAADTAVVTSASSASPAPAAPAPKSADLAMSAVPARATESQAPSATVVAAGNPDAAPADPVRLSADMHGEEAIAALGDKLAAVAAAHNMSAEALRNELRKDKDLWVRQDGQLYYACSGLVEYAPAEQAATAQAESVGGLQPLASVPISTPPLFHSKPGSTQAIYLCFTGYVFSSSSRWGSYDCYPYSTDGDYTTFSDAEQTNIKRIWQRVAEDYSPLDVDVTTEKPTAGKYGFVMITGNKDKNGKPTPAASVGGIATRGSFGPTNTSALPHCWVAYQNVGSAGNAAMVATHETGHTLGLSHDQTSVNAYYYGHGSGEISWAPIMGVGYNKHVVQFSKGEYYDYFNYQEEPDDFAVMTTYLLYRSDDVGNSNTSATPLVVFGGTNISSTTPETDAANVNPQNKGIINQTNDVDVWSFATGAGAIALAVNPWISPADTRGGCLDVRLELRDEAGALVASADPPANTYATITATVARGTYYLHVRPTGTGTPMANPPSGYTVYGSRGQYFISGTVLSTASTNDPAIAGPLPLPVVNPGQPVNLAVTATGTAPMAFQWQKNGTNLVGATATNYTIASAAQSNEGAYRCIVTNANGSATSIVTRLTVNDAPTANAASVTTDEDVAKLIVPTGNDPEGMTLTYTVLTQPAHGTLKGVAPVNLTYTPAANYNGTDSFTFKANDGVLDSAPATVSITVTPVNDPPGGQMTAPAYGATFTAPALITIQAEGWDGDGTIAKIEFFVNSLKVGEDTNSPYACTWSGVPAGAYALTVTITDNAGANNTRPALPITVLAATNDPPVAPVVLAATSVLTNGFNANWSAGAGGAAPTNYYLSVTQGAGYVPGYSNRSVGLVTTWAVIGLTPGTVYSYRVLAGNAGGTSPASASTNVTTVAVYALSVAVNNPKWGSVLLTGGTYAAGASVGVTATAAPYCHFESWGGDTGGCWQAGNVMTAAMSRVRSLTASFDANRITNGPPGTATPEEWLASYYDVTQFWAANTNDTDHDGMAGWAEYIAGTDPTNRLSCLVMSAPTAAPGGANGYVVSWQSKSNKFYTVQAATNLVVGFTNLTLGSNIPATYPVNVYTDNVSGVGSRFYRVKVAE